MTIKGRCINPGAKTAPAIVTSQLFGFWGGVDTKTGVIIDKRHELCGQKIKDKVFVFPEGRGSTVGAAIILELVRCNNAPAAIVNIKTEGILAAGAIIAAKLYNVTIPVVDGLSREEFESIKNGDMVTVNATTGEIKIGG